MTVQVYIVLLLTFVIYLIGVLAYSIRVVGIRTRMIAVAFAIFNIFYLISRTANTLQAPLLAKTIENSINMDNYSGLLSVFRWILIATTLSTVIGAMLLPTFIKFFSKLVESFNIHRSIPKVLMRGFSKSGIEQLKKTIILPRRGHLLQFVNFHGIPRRLIVINIITAAMNYVAILASLYAGVLNPELRTTCSTLSSVINSVATILSYIFIEPYLSMLTDDVVKGKYAEADFNRCISFMVGGLIIGSVLAQFLLVPGAELIVIVSKLI